MPLSTSPSPPRSASLPEGVLSTPASDSAITSTSAFLHPKAPDNNDNHFLRPTSATTPVTPHPLPSVPRAYYERHHLRSHSYHSTPSPSHTSDSPSRYPLTRNTTLSGSPALGFSSSTLTGYPDAKGSKFYQEPRLMAANNTGTNLPQYMAPSEALAQPSSMVLSIPESTPGLWHTQSHSQPTSPVTPFPPNRYRPRTSSTLLGRRPSLLASTASTNQTEGAHNYQQSGFASGSGLGLGFSHEVVDGGEQPPRLVMPTGPSFSALRYQPSFESTSSNASGESYGSGAGSSLFSIPSSSSALSEAYGQGYVLARQDWARRHGHRLPSRMASLDSLEESHNPRGSFATEQSSVGGPFYYYQPAPPSLHPSVNIDSRPFEYRYPSQATSQSLPPSLTSLTSTSPSVASFAVPPYASHNGFSSSPSGTMPQLISPSGLMQPTPSFPQIPRAPNLGHLSLNPGADGAGTHSRTNSDLDNSSIASGSTSTPPKKGGHRVKREAVSSGSEDGDENNGTSFTAAGSDGGKSEDTNFNFGVNRPKKLAIACHFCRRRKMKCDGSRPTCSQCQRRDQVCTYDAAPRMRGRGRKKLAEEAAKREAAETAVAFDTEEEVHQHHAPMGVFPSYHGMPLSFTHPPQQHTNPPGAIPMPVQAVPLGDRDRLDSEPIFTGMCIKGPGAVAVPMPGGPEFEMKGFLPGESRQGWHQSNAHIAGVDLPPDAATAY